VCIGIRAKDAIETREKSKSLRVRVGFVRGERDQDQDQDHEGWLRERRMRENPFSRLQFPSKETRRKLSQASNRI